MSSSVLTIASNTYSVGQRVHYNDPISGWTTGTVQYLVGSISDKRGFLGGCGSVSDPGAGSTTRYRLLASDAAVASVLGFGRAVREIQVAPSSNPTELLATAIILSPSGGGDYWTAFPLWLAIPGGTASGGVVHALDSALHPCLASLGGDAAATNLDPDLFRIDDLHISVLTNQLARRYEQRGEQYSRMGSTIVSVNPFAAKEFNAARERDRYLDKWRSSGGNTSVTAAALPPHVWSIAENAYNGAILEGAEEEGPTFQVNHQSVVISGESGSGKTENTKMIIDYLGCLSSLHSCNAAQRQLALDVSTYLRASNPILELFGNAKTVRNDNSSRFGKYTKLWFNKKSGVMIGAEMETYLLERSRVVAQGPGERNYHIFYALIGVLGGSHSFPPSLPPDTQAALRKLSQTIASVLGGGSGGRSAVPGPEGFRLLQQGGEFTRRGIDGRAVVDEVSEFVAVQQSLVEMGMPEEAQSHLWYILGAILLLGEVTFVTSESTGKAAVPGLNNNGGSTSASLPARAFAAACDLLGLRDRQDDFLRECFLEKSKSAILTTMATASEASDLRDSLCKHLYVSVFDHLVRTVNSKLAPAPEMTADANQVVYIGVLDIFGFESFKKNGFEQICINYANEALQGHYNAFTFAADEEECAAEGIPCANVNYPDSTPCLSLFNMSKVGVFDALDEESNFKGGTSERYTQCLWDRFGEPQKDAASAHFVRPKGTVPSTFSVKHFASTVTYDTAGWVSRNADTMKEEGVVLLSVSNLSLLRTIMNAASLPSTTTPPNQANAGPPKRKPTVSRYFRTQLDNLMRELRGTSSHFVRCIKPNTLAKPQFMDVRYTCLQLESAGVIQTIALKRQGFAIRRAWRDLHQQFLPLIRSRLFAGKGMLKHASSFAASSGCGGSVAPQRVDALVAALGYCFNWDPSPQAVSRRRSQLRKVLSEEQVALTNHIRDRRSLPTPASSWLLLMHASKRINPMQPPSTPLFTEEEIDAIVTRLMPEGPYFAIGKTKFFLREPAWARMEHVLRRYKRRCLALCLPHLKRWVTRFRLSKAKQEAERKAALKALQDQATQRRSLEEGGPAATAGSSHQASTNSKEAKTATFLRDVGRGSSLPQEKQSWFEEVAVVFRNFDLPVLLDVVYNLNSREKVVRALTEMQAQRLNATLPGTLLRLFKEAGISTAVAENFAANGISSIDELARLPRSRLVAFGLTPKQVGVVMNRMMGQQGELLINERLRVACLDVSAPAEATAPFSPLGGGYSPKYNESGERALPPLPASQPRNARRDLDDAVAVARTDARAMLQENEDAKIQRMMELGIASRDVCAAALRQCDGNSQQATAFILDGRVPRDSQTQRSSRPQPHRKSRHSREATEADAAKLNYLTGMGFATDVAAAALIRCNNDANAALELCIANT